jgi:hypothetical protein
LWWTAYFNRMGQLDVLSSQRGTQPSGLYQLLSAGVRVQIVKSTHFKWEPNKLPLDDYLVEVRNQHRPLHELNRPKDSGTAIRGRAHRNPLADVAQSRDVAFVKGEGTPPGE